VPRASIQTVERAVAGVCTAARPFPIRLGRLTVFPSPQGNFVVLRVAQARQLMRLHRQLIETLDPLTVLADPMEALHEEDGFVPHITLLQRVPDGEVPAVIAALARTPVRHAFPVEQIVLICQEPGSPWQETQHFPLRRDGGVAGPAAAAPARTPDTPDGGSQL
jgi:2'-5' RNA ligase